MLVGVYKLKQNDVDNIDSHILTILPIKITINKSKEPNIVLLSLNFILDTSWVALYSVVCEYVRHR